MRTAGSICCLLMLASCGEPAEVQLIVQLRTDLVAGSDFFAAELSLPDDGMSALPVAFEAGQDFSRGARIAELPLDPSFERRVEVRLFDVNGDETIAATVLVTQAADQIVTVVISRDCRAVVCPGEGDAPGATRCLAGRCTVPECVTGAEASCPEPECTENADCPAESACTEGLCADGVCLLAPTDGRCAEGEFCEPTGGCTPIPTVMEADECGAEAYAIPPPCEGDTCTVVATQVDSSATHACALTADELLCWGSNQDGQLGTGDRLSRLRATPVTPIGTLAQIAVGDGFTCAITEDAALFCWGRNGEGQLGLGDTTARTVPTRVGADDIKWVHMSANSATVCAIDNGARLYCWGRNSEGQTGHGIPGGEPPPVLTPTPVGTDLWGDVSVGEGHACAVREDAEVFCWGRNTDGQLGVLDPALGQVRTPRAVTMEASWQEVETGPVGTCAIRTEGTMACWGDTSDGRLGVPPGATGPVMPPTERMGLYEAVEMDVFHGCAMRPDASVECWGRAIEGQLGLSRVDPVLEPLPVLEGESVQALSVARFTTHIATANGLFAAGNGCATLGTGELGRAHAFTPVTR